MLTAHHRCYKVRVSSFGVHRQGNQHQPVCLPDTPHLSLIHFDAPHISLFSIKWEDHRLTINGLVNTPTTFTMDELTTKFLQMVTTLPVTLVCAGVRWYFSLMISDRLEDAGGDGWFCVQALIRKTVDHFEHWGHRHVDIVPTTSLLLYVFGCTLSVLARYVQQGTLG